jgi:hypothetical protein
MSLLPHGVNYKCDCGRREVRKTVGIQISTNICAKLDPTGQVKCTRTARHQGDHVACTEKECDMLIWPEIPPIPKKIRQIRAL